MSKKKDRITRRLSELGMAWATQPGKYCDPSDPYEDQIARRATYHIHPNASWPHENSIERFKSLDEIERFLDENERLQAGATTARLANDAQGERDGLENEHRRQGSTSRLDQRIGCKHCG